MDHFIQTIGVCDIHHRLLVVKAKLYLCKQQLCSQSNYLNETLPAIHGLLADVLTFWENPEYDGLFIPSVLSYQEIQTTKQIALQHVKEVEHDVEVFLSEKEFVCKQEAIREHYLANRNNICIIDAMAIEEPEMAVGERIVYWLTAIRDDFFRFNRHMNTLQRTIFAEHNYFPLLKLIVNFVLKPNGAFHEENADYLREHGFIVSREPNTLQTLQLSLADLGEIHLDLATIKRIAN